MTVYHKIAYQGAPGAFSDMAARAMFPELERLPCPSFDAAFAAVADGVADLAMIPIDNTLAGRVADVHHLLAHRDLHIIGEWFQPIEMCLIGVPGAKLADVRDVYSHIHAIPQCRHFIAAHGFAAHAHKDTAGAVRDVAEWRDVTKAAIGSTLAAELYGLQILAENIHDEKHNTTRFIVLAREGIKVPDDLDVRIMTSALFSVRHIPAALYKALGGFATNGIQVTKLESYVGEGFQAARFYIDIEGHPDDPAMAQALDELRYFSTDLRIMGTYVASPWRGA